MLISDLVVEVRDVHLNRLGQLTEDDLADFTVNPIANDVGVWELHLPQTIVDPVTGDTVDYALTQYLRTEGAGIIVTGPNGVILSGPMTEAKFEATSEEPDGLWTITGISDTVVLQDALAYPDPKTADATKQTRDNDSRNAPAETLLYQYVSANIGPAAPSARRWADLTLLPDQGRGGMAYASPRFDNLLTLLQSIALVGGLQFDVVQQGSGRVFRVWQPIDRSALVSFDVDNGQLSTVDHGYGSPTATRVIVGGPGDNVLDRTFVSRTTAASTAAEASWGRRIEGFIADTSTDDTVVLGQEGDAALAENGTTVRSTSITPTEDLADSYLVDWGLGDLVTVVVGTTPAHAPVASAILKSGDDGLLVGLTLGDLSGFDPDGVAYALAQDTADRVASLERSGSTGSTAAAVDLSAYAKTADVAPALLISVRSSTAAPSAYPVGVSAFTVSTSDTGWPPSDGALGLVLTTYLSTSRVLQEVTLKNSGRRFFRTADGNGTGWSAWSEVSILGHTHDDRYYTETEIDSKLAGKQAAGSYATTSQLWDIANITHSQYDAGSGLGGKNSFWHGYLPDTYAPKASIADVGWTNIGYASGFSAGSANQLRYCVRYGVLYIEGGAQGSFASGSYTAISAALPSAYRPGVVVHWGAFGQSGRMAGMQLDTGGVISAVWYNGGTGYTAPAWISGMVAIPLPA